ncbi:hypothetical protein HMPREF0988_02941 [Lachnospiraceae bacterium 1_4_56FAA]|nr:hypothetical protein HMPREF0988_02941 [Lachnospiraceae bacterium 1_4_56FAA]
MDNLEKMKQEKQYEEYVTQKTPKHNVWANMLKAFLTGGIICTIGQAIYNYCELQSLSKDACSGWTSLLLILASVILTGMNLYPRIAKWGGAGALVPITGFANSVAAPAIEYKKRGRFSESAARSSRSPVRSSYTGSLQAACLVFSTGSEK